MPEEIDLNPFGKSNTGRLTTQTAEKVLFHPQDTNHGFVRLVDYQGGDSSILHAATGGVGREAIISGSQLTNTEIFSSLLATGAYDPLDFVQLKLHMRTPIQTALFWVYERRFRINEESARYSVMSDQTRQVALEELAQIFGMGPVEELDKKQISYLESLVQVISGTQAQARGSYEAMLAGGFTRELARIGIGLGNTTQFLREIIEATQKAKKLSRLNPDLGPFAEQIEALCKQVAPIGTDVLLHHPGESLELKVNYDALEAKPNGKPRYPSRKTKRLTIPAAEQSLFHPVDYLTHGWFMATDYMGGDRAVPQSARVSYGAGTTQASDDVALLRYLRRHRHTTPFEHVVVVAEQSAPFFVYPRQGGRHRTQNKAGVLGLYIPLRAHHELNLADIRGQSKTNKQGRAEPLEIMAQSMIASNLDATFNTQAWARQELQKAGVPDHIIHMLQGVGHFTRSSFSVDLHNGLGFLRLRDHSHAQKEIQLNARLLGDFIGRVAPESMRAFDEYERNALTFSVTEQKLVRRMLRERRTTVPNAWLGEFGWLTKSGNPKREAQEFLDKLGRLREV